MTECYMCKRDILVIIKNLEKSHRYDHEIKYLAMQVYKIMDSTDDMRIALSSIKELDKKFSCQTYLRDVVEFLEIAISGECIGGNKSAFFEWRKNHMWNKEYYPIYAGFSRKNIPVVCFYCPNDADAGRFAYSVQFAGSGYYFETAEKMQDWYALCMVK